MISLVIELPRYMISDDAHSKAILKNYILDMLAMMDQEMVTNKVHALVSIKQTGKSGLHPGVTYIQYPAYFEAAVQVWVETLNRTKVNDSQIGCMDVEGYRQSQGRVHSNSQGMECHSCRLGAAPVVPRRLLQDERRSKGER